MSKEQEGGEKSREYSKDEVKRAQDLIRTTREVVEWDLGKNCSTTEEIAVVNKCKGAMRDIETLFHIPKTKRWLDFSGKAMGESMRQADEYNAKSLNYETLNFSPTDLDKFRLSLGAIDEVLGWDIAVGDETEIRTLSDTRASLPALNEYL
ncbi:MAG: hypothetical protein NUV84_02310 [Candidatus Uhrbacteria bacterium]|nr:hypothetical protein [Candidatus Uhrbacteria bacterium]